MDWIYLLGLLVQLAATFFIILILINDCDVLTFFADKLGKSPATVFPGKVVWLTGASSGIGECIALELAKCGAQLVLSARRKDELDRVKKDCLNSNPSLQEKDILVLPLDMVYLQSHEPSLQKILHHFGKLDVLISNAGRYLKGDWQEIDLAVDKELFEVNVFSVINMNRLVVKYFLQVGGGQVAVMSSIVGEMALMLCGPYVAAKHALHGYFNTLRLETHEKNIDVTLICPGFVQTPIFHKALTHKHGVVWFANAVHSHYQSTPNDMTQSRKTTEGKPLQREMFDNQMTPERCAYLSLVSIANRLNESWMAVSPIIALRYFKMFFPVLTDFLMSLVAPFVIRRMKSNQ